MTEIAIIGAGGSVGKALIGALNAEHVDYRVISHSDAGRSRLRAAGAPDPVLADLDSPPTLARALTNVRAVYAIPPSLHPREDELLINAVRAAEASGVERFVYHSVLHPNTPFLRNHQRKARVEAVLRTSRLNWTILQPSMYAQVVLAMFGAARSGTVEIPFDVDVPLSILDLVDCAVVSVRTLRERDVHDFATYELAGPTTTMRQAVSALRRIRGSELHATAVAVANGPLPPAAMDDPEAAADMISTYAHYDRHGFRGNPSVLTGLLGRSPATLDEVIAREYDAVMGVRQ